MTKKLTLSAVLRASNDGIVAIRHDFDGIVKKIQARLEALEKAPAGRYVSFPLKVNAACAPPSTVLVNAGDDKTLADCAAKFDPEEAFDPRVIDANARRSERQRIAAMLRERAEPLDTEFKLLVRELADQLDSNGGGGQGTPEMHARPAAPTLPESMPERPEDLDEPWAEDCVIEYAALEQERRYALTLESRLRETEKERDQWREIYSLKLDEYLTARHERAEFKEEVVALRTSLSASESRVRELEKFYRDVASAVGVEYQADGHATQPGPMDAVLDAVTSNIEDVPRLASDVSTLRTSLSRCREALGRVRQIVDERETTLRSIVGPPATGFMFACIDRIRNALAAAGDENTGDAAGTVTGDAKRPNQTCGLGDENQGAREPTHHIVVEQAPGGLTPLDRARLDRPSTVTAESQAGSTPAIAHPSPRFELSETQREILSSLVLWFVHSYERAPLDEKRERWSELQSWISSLVQSDREGWVNAAGLSAGQAAFANDYIRNCREHNARAGSSGNE